MRLTFTEFFFSGRDENQSNKLYELGGGKLSICCGDL